jgi:hypothetical protein
VLAVEPGFLHQPVTNELSGISGGVVLWHYSKRATSTGLVDVSTIESTALVNCHRYVIRVKDICKEAQRGDPLSRQRLPGVYSTRRMVATWLGTQFSFERCESGEGL